MFGSHWKLCFFWSSLLLHHVWTYHWSVCLQNLPKLCSVVAECVSAFSVDFWLQTNLFQCGVLWHLLLYLFNYDYTLEEGGVEKSGESNQQVSYATAVGWAEFDFLLM